ncbi:hypothetical protein NL108_004078 [Boleophthalmus pectinirostris]|nr:hypothetical protein NL108_004078 [Boleophthalmus pectinirostris]
MSGAEGQEDEPPECVEVCIDVRIHKLQNRRFFLQQLQHVTRKAEDDEDESELELVERELQELLQQKESLASCRTATDTGPVGISSYISKVETEGIYTLPPFHFTPDPLPPPMIRNVPEPVPPEEPLPPPPPPPEEPPSPPPPPEEPPSPPPCPPPPPEEPPVEPSSEDDDIKHIEPVDNLGRGGAFTLCPSCKQVVFTQTKKYNGESAWLMSCIVYVTLIKIL